MKRHRFLMLAAALALVHTASMGAQIELYETGPAEDASFVRFVNGGATPMEIIAKGSQARVQLDAAHSVSDFLPVRAGTQIGGTLASGDLRQDVAISVKPGEFATVVGITAEGGKLQAVVVREQPDDFNALKASVGFYNLDASCADAGLLAAGRNVAIFEHVADAAAARRQVNPVALAVQASCGGKPAGTALDLGNLQAGERHTVLLLPSANGPRLLHAVDTLAH